jgi:hypothetical protein
MMILLSKIRELQMDAVKVSEEEMAIVQAAIHQCTAILSRIDDDTRLVINELTPQGDH